MHRRPEEHTGLVAGAMEDPIVCVQWLAQCRTNVGCSGPTVASSQAAWAEALRRVPVDLLGAAHLGRTAAVEGSPEAGNLGLGEDILGPEADPEAGSPEAGSPGLGAGRHVRSTNQRARGLQDQHHLGLRHTNHGKGHSGILKELELAAQLYDGEYLPAGFLSSSSMSSFIFFLRKSMIQS